MNYRNILLNDVNVKKKYILKLHDDNQYELIFCVGTMKKKPIKSFYNAWKSLPCINNTKNAHSH